MSEPKISRFSKETRDCHKVLSIEGPDPDGYYAAIIENGMGKISCYTYESSGRCQHGHSGFDLMPAKPQPRIEYLTVALNAFNWCVIDASSSAKFNEANLALIFEGDKLIGSKVL